MKHKHIEVKDWETIAGISEFAMLQVAMERGCLGDIKSMKTMLDYFEIAGLPSIAQRRQDYETHVWVQMDFPAAIKPIKINSVAAKRTFGDLYDSKIQQSSFQAAIAISLAREPHERMDPLLMSSINHFTDPDERCVKRTSKLESQEFELLAKAIEVWKAPVVNMDFDKRTPAENSKAPGYEGLHKLFQVLGSMSVGDQSFVAFEKAGFTDGQCLALLLRDAFPKLDSNGQAIPTTLASDLMGSGNLAASHWCARAMLAAEEVPHYDAAAAQKEFLDKFSVRSFESAPYIGAILKDVIEQTKNGTITPSLTIQENALIDMFWTLSSYKIPSSMVDERMGCCITALSMVLDHFPALVNKPMVWRPEFVDALLKCAPTENLSVAQHLAKWDTTFSSPSSRSFALTSRPEYKLISAAVKHHCVPVLDAAAPVLKEAARCMCFPGTPKGWPWGLSMMGKTEGPLHAENFGKSIEIFKKAGMDFNELFDVALDPTDHHKLKKTSLVHLLAESQHEHTNQAMLELLKADVNTKVKNGRGWIPSSCIRQDDMKKEWIGLERAFAAKKEALNVMDEINGLILKIK